MRVSCDVDKIRNIRRAEFSAVQTLRQQPQKTREARKVFCGFLCFLRPFFRSNRCGRSALGSLTACAGDVLFFDRENDRQENEDCIFLSSIFLSARAILEFSRHSIYWEENINSNVCGGAIPVETASSRIYSKRLFVGSEAT